VGLANEASFKHESMGEAAIVRWWGSRNQSRTCDYARPLLRGRFLVLILLKNRWLLFDGSARSWGSQSLEPKVGAVQ